MATKTKKQTPKFIRFRNGSKIAIPGPTGPIQHCADLPKKKQKKPSLSGDKLVVVLVTPSEINAVHSFLQAMAITKRHALPDAPSRRLEPLLQGIARGWIMQP